MLEQILGSRIKLKIIRFMLQKDREFLFKDIAKSIKTSFGAVHPALSELVELRILLVKKIGRSKLYSINKSHFLFLDIRRLFDEEMKRPFKIAKEFAQKLNKTGIKNIILFGSVARREFKQKSDIDILIIYSRKKIDNHADVLSDRILRKYDINVSVTYLSYKEVRSRIKRFDIFIFKILNEGMVLFGDDRWLKK